MAQGQQFDFDALSRYLNFQDRRNTQLGVSPIIDAVQNYGGMMQGAMGQMAGLHGANANAMASANARADAMRLQREAAHDKNQKFTMLYDSLLKPTMMWNYQAGREMPVSPLLTALGGGSLESMGFAPPGGNSQNQGVAGGAMGMGGSFAGMMPGMMAGGFQGAMQSPGGFNVPQFSF